jgi:hypothetical protein
LHKELDTTQHPTKHATVSLPSNVYEVGPVAACRSVGLIYDPFDLTRSRSVSKASRWGWPSRTPSSGMPAKARCETSAADAAPSAGIDYLWPSDDSHTRTVQEPVGDDALWSIHGDGAKQPQIDLAHADTTSVDAGQEKDVTAL